jgi:DNA (cytosine-5)-methyltransferase 1
MTAPLWTPPNLDGLTFTDIFCGAGGSSIGLAMAGFQLKLAANHWDRAIETHSANFRNAEHLCADVNNYDMRRLPSTDILWASPICTETSPAGGNRKGRRPAFGQGDLLEAFGPVGKGAHDRTRATFWDVIRATEVHRYKVVMVENVPEAADWELFDIWIMGMVKLGYDVQFVSVNSAHAGGAGIPYAPQWRDRLYMVFTRTGIRKPNLELRPASWCASCGGVEGVQQWIRAAECRPFRVGRYRRNPRSSYGQYWYRCPNVRCGKRVEPFVLPAAAAIDWADLGERIGDRAKPLAANTLRRIQAGLEMFAQPITATVAGNTFERAGYLRAWPAYGVPVNTMQATITEALACPPFMFNANHDDDRMYRADGQPLSARSTKIGDGFVYPPLVLPLGGPNHAEPARNAAGEPMSTRLANDGGTDALVTPQAFLTVLRSHAEASSVQEPVRTVATGNNQYLTVPPGAFYVMNYGNGGTKTPHRLCRSVGEPIGAITANDGTSLVVPYYTKGRADTPDHPLGAVSTVDRYALVNGSRAIEVDDCLLRMLKPVESLAAQAFPTGNPHGYPGIYQVHGNLGEQTMQAGNAVTASVAHRLGRAVAEVL